MNTFVVMDCYGVCSYGCLWTSVVSFRTIEYSKITTQNADLRCYCGICKVSDTVFQNVMDQNFDLDEIFNHKDTSKNDAGIFTEEFYHYMHDSLNELYGVKNVVIMDNRIVIKKSTIDIEAIIALFTEKLSIAGYHFSLSNNRQFSTYELLHLSQIERTNLIKFIV